MDCLAGALLAYITANVIQSTTAITHRTHSKFRTSVNEIEDNYSHRSQADPEDNLRYFREDISINSHHWYWHMLNSYKWTPKAGETRDRKGELLFHMHRQVIARYDADRISCYLPAVLALQDLRKPIPEGYLPKFVNKYSSVQFMGRRPNMTLQDVPSEGLKIGTLEKWSGRILEAISSGVAMNKDGSTTDLRTPVGIDILAAMIESSASSVNADYYGNYHNLLHTALSRISNPNDHPDEFGTIAYESVAMRDPVFYRLHKTVDQLFEEYKSRLPPYTENEVHPTY